MIRPHVEVLPLDETRSNLIATSPPFRAYLRILSLTCACSILIGWISASTSRSAMDACFVVTPDWDLLRSMTTGCVLVHRGGGTELCRSLCFWMRNPRGCVPC